MLSNQAGAAHPLESNTNTPANDDSAILRRKVLTLSKDDQRFVAFLSAEEKMLALRMSRVPNASESYRTAARADFERRVQEVLNRQVEPLPSQTKVRSSRGARG